MRGCYFYLFLLFLTSSSTTVIAWYLPSETNLETSNIISPSMHDPVHTDIRYFLIKDYLISYFLLIQVLLRKNISFLRWNNARQIYSVFFQFHLHKYFCKLFLKCNFFHFYVNKYPQFFFISLLLEIDDIIITCVVIEMSSYFRNFVLLCTVCKNLLSSLVSANNLHVELITSSYFNTVT